MFYWFAVAPYQDNSYCVGELDAYLADRRNINNCTQFWQQNVNKFPNSTSCI